MNFTEAALDNGQRIRLATVTGTVISAATSRSTSVSQDAPLILSKNFVIPGTVRSTVHTRQELWLRDDEGRERAYRLAGLELPAREGHRISIVFGAPAWQSEGAIFGAMNHSSGDLVCDIMVLGKTLRSWRLDIGQGKSLLTWAIVCAILLALVAYALTTSQGDKPAMAMFGGIVGAVLGSVCWAFIGSRLGPEARALKLVSQINELGIAALRSAG